jgi:Flp pilus assembly pilin Flp
MTWQQGRGAHKQRLCVVQALTVRSAERHVAGATERLWWSSLGAMVMKTLLNKLVRDEQGGEVLEYALIAGLIVVAAIAVITSVGGKVLARWTSLNSSL